MKRERVSSSAIAAIGYEAPTETLEIRFITGGLYRYRGVPQAVYDDLMAANSRGRFLREEIVDLYPYQRLD